MTIDVAFDASAEAASRYRQVRIVQNVHHVNGGGKKAMADNLSDSKNGKEVSIVFHYPEEGSHELKTRTVGKISRNTSGKLLLTLFGSRSGVFDTGMNDFAPVKELRLIRCNSQSDGNAKKAKGVIKAVSRSTHSRGN